MSASGAQYLPQIARLLGDVGLRADLSGNAVTVRGSGGETQISIDALNGGTENAPEPREVVRVVHRLPGVINREYPGLLRWNKYSSMSALLLGRQPTTPPALGARIPLSTTNDSYLKGYGVLSAGAAFMAQQAATLLVPGPQCALDNLESPKSVDPVEFGLRYSRHPQEYTPEHFEAAGRWCKDRKLPYRIDEGRLVAGLPWRPGQTEASVLPEDLSTFEVRAREMHPWFGGGWWALLRLPFTVPREQLHSLPNEMNLTEMGSPDLSCSIGSWVPAERGQLGWVCFIPADFCIDGLPTLLTAWSLHRSLWARQWLEYYGHLGTGQPG